MARQPFARSTAALLFAALLLGITPPPRAVDAASPPASAPKAAPVATPVPIAHAAERPRARASAKPAPEPFIVRRILDIPGPMTFGSHVWDDAGVPPGPLVITVDLAAQTMSVFRGGYEIGAAVIVHGASDKPTPLGIFPITQKKRHHISNLYGAPMPYMLRLTNDGVAIHASDVRWGNASHGCIGIPPEFAALLFAQARLGDRVIVTDGQRMDISHLRR